MWKEKVELHWRIQGHKEWTKHCKQVIWGLKNPKKTGKMKAVCFSNTLANFYQTIWCHTLEDCIIHCYSWYVDYVLEDAPIFLPMVWNIMRRAPLKLSSLIPCQPPPSAFLPALSLSLIKSKS